MPEIASRENLAARVAQSEHVLQWVHAKLDKAKLHGLSENKRVQLASACWHVAIEHSASIMVLIDQGMYGSALALVRPLFEAYVRGLWLGHSASETEVDDAGRDEFPRDFDRLVQTPAKSGFGVAELKSGWWKRLCSFTHTGYQQIGARLTAEGLGYDYQRSEMDQALQWADAIALLCVVSFADVMQNNEAANEVHAYFRALSAPTASAPQLPAL